MKGKTMENVANDEREFLADALEALWGPRAVAPFARAVNVSETTARAWLAGRSPVPDNVRADLLRLFHERADLLDGLIGYLEEEGVEPSPEPVKKTVRRASK